MLLEPNVIVLYVDNLALTSHFYQDLLGINPIEASPTFHHFKLSNGMDLALKTKASVIPPLDENSGLGELAFLLDDDQNVDRLFRDLQTKDMKILSPPSILAFGYTFLAIDPNGNRLCVCSLVK